MKSNYSQLMNDNENLLQVRNDNFPSYQQYIKKMQKVEPCNLIIIVGVTHDKSKCGKNI